MLELLSLLNCVTKVCRLSLIAFRHFTIIRPHIDKYHIRNQHSRQSNAGVQGGNHVVPLSRRTCGRLVFGTARAHARQAARGISRLVVLKNHGQLSVAWRACVRRHDLDFGADNNGPHVGGGREAHRHRRRLNKRGSD